MNLRPQLLARPQLRSSAVAAAVLGLALLSCAQPEARTGASALVELPSPAGTQSGEPFLSSDRSGGVHLSWLERTGDSTFALRYSSLAGDQWAPPATIAERGDFFVNWADFPSVQATAEGTLIAHWLQRRPGGKYSYDVMLARSSDSGRRWSPGTVLNRDGVAAEHGFLAMWMPSSGGAEAAWLDGRGSASPDTAQRAMSVYTTSIAADGSLGDEQPLDRRTCDCCQVAATLTPSGPVVAYRDRTADDVRDIAVVRRVGGVWTEPQVVHHDDWQIAACPVNGPALASRGDTVVIAWFTGAQDTARVRVAYSTDAGAHFGPPVRIDGGMPAGRVDVEALDDGSAAVSWLERSDSASAEVRLRRVRSDGSMGAPMVLARSAGARASGFPRITRQGNALIVAWTDTGDESRVRVARFPLAALP
ncbi:MAG: sialidase family protein [Gemmatimonadota bacterium]